MSDEARHSELLAKIMLAIPAPYRPTLWEDMPDAIEQMSKS